MHPGERDIAVIGMACVFPMAPDLTTYWRNIVTGVDASSELPDKWECDTFFQPDASSNDRIYCKRGGFLRELARFDPLAYGVMPAAIGGEPDHFLALQVADQALADAGFHERRLDGKRVEVILGKGTYINSGYTNLLQHGFIVDQTIEILKQLAPERTAAELKEIRSALKASLPQLTADTVPAIVPNIVTGRIANRLNLMGANYTVDAACASSLIAVQQAVEDLRARRCDMVLAGGVHASTPPQILMLFCQLNALSRVGKIRPFDAAADGTMLGEGVGIMILKRRHDAERDGHRIYAVIKCVETASDGKALGLLAPSVDGEELAIRRAYEASGISPASVELVEAHGTGTLVGDITEMEALTRVFGQRRGIYPDCAIGSVKSMITHLLPAAGIASLIKTALALYHRALPPTLHCDTPNPKLRLERTRFYLNTAVRPWVHGGDEPRRAGINAFGFGGINAHAILEEHVSGCEPAGCSWPRWESEVFVVHGQNWADVKDKLTLLDSVAANLTAEDLSDLAYTVNCSEKWGSCRLAIIVAHIVDLRAKLATARQVLAGDLSQNPKTQRGLQFALEGLSPQPKLAFVFPGEGSQYVGMLQDLCLQFPAVRGCFDRSDQVFRLNGSEIRPSDLLFPPTHALLPPQFSPEGRLWDPDVAAETVFTADYALSTLMARFRIRPDSIVGHSSGEFAALAASGALAWRDERQLIQTSTRLNHLFASISNQVPVARLMTVGCADRALIAEVITLSQHRIRIAMDNCPHQVILSGSEDDMQSALQTLSSRAAICTFLPFSRAYHTPDFLPVAAQLAGFFDSLEFATPSVPLYSCKSAEVFPSDTAGVRRLACEQWSEPVRFRETIENMYRDGIRIFVEVGPRANLTGFIADILGKRPHIAVPLNKHGQSGLAQLNHAIGVLAANNVPMSLEYLYQHRSNRRASVSDFSAATVATPIRDSEVRLGGALPRLNLADQFRQPKAPQASVSSMLGKACPEIATGPMASPPGSTAASPKVQVLERHFANMQAFADNQREVMQAFLQRVHRSPKVADEAPDQWPAVPFRFELDQLEPGRKLLARYQFSLDEDIFLKDHVIGRDVSDLDRHRIGIPVVPLTVSVEIMAQAAAMLAPEKHLVRIRDLRAYRWIELADSGGRAVALSATVQRHGIFVSMMDPGCDISSGVDHKLLEGVFEFADTYPSPPTGKCSCNHEISFAHERSQYYQIMFHGPLFQTVQSINGMENHCIDATLAVAAGSRMFRSHPDGKSLTNPVLMDGAGQVIGFWAWDRFDAGFTIFPFGFDTMHLYAPFPSAPAVKCHANVRALADGRIESDIDLYDAHEGRQLTRIECWKDMRLFDWSRPFANFVLAPKSHLFTDKLFPALGDGVECRGVFQYGTGIWQRLLARLILTDSETDLFRSMAKSEAKGRDWLLCRLAAKDAVRGLVQRLTTVELCPADIGIIDDVTDRCTISPDLMARIGFSLRVCIACDEGCAMAIAALESGCTGVGAAIGPAVATADEELSELDQDFLEGVPDNVRAEHILRARIASIALAKALGEHDSSLAQPQSVTSSTGAVSFVAARPADGGSGKHQLPVDTVVRGKVLCAAAVI